MITRILTLMILMFALALSGCNIEKAAEKFRPQAAAEFDDKVITALLERDKDFFMDQFAHTYEDASIPEKGIDHLFTFVPEGEERSRVLVGARTHSSMNVSTGEGSSRTRTWTTTYELGVGDEYMSVENSYTTNDDGACCVLTNVNVNSYDTPQLSAQIEQMQKGANIALATIGVLIVLIIGLIIFLVRRSKRKKAAQNLQ